MTPSPVQVIAEPLGATIAISIADPALRQTMAAAVSEAVRATSTSFELPDLRVVRLRTRKRFARLGVEGVKGALVVVKVTEANARRLPELVEGLRAAGCAGVQLVWDGHDPARERVERHVFSVLERARSTPAGPPVVLSEDAEPALSLRILVAHRTNDRATEGHR